MATLNDKEFKERLAALNPAQQRQVAARFIHRAFALSGDLRVKAALKAAVRADVSETELAGIAQAANAARVESYTQCGKETDWNVQAGHFVAKAAADCVRPIAEGQSLAWDAAMLIRVARTCGAASGDTTDHKEAEAQYAILDDFLSK